MVAEGRGKDKSELEGIRDTSGSAKRTRGRGRGERAGNGRVPTVVHPSEGRDTCVVIEDRGGCTGVFRTFKVRVRDTYMSGRGLWPPISYLLRARSSWA